MGPNKRTQWGTIDSKQFFSPDAGRAEAAPKQRILPGPLRREMDYLYSVEKTSVKQYQELWSNPHGMPLLKLSPVPH